MWEGRSVLCKTVVGKRIEKKDEDKKNHNMVVFNNGTGRYIRRTARKVAFKRSRNGIETVMHAVRTEVRSCKLKDIMDEKRRRAGIVKVKCFGRVRI